MTQVENYKNLLEDIFETDIIFSNPNIENNCIGALIENENYACFRTNFIERLKRLKNHFQDSEIHITELITTAKQIGQTRGYKWAGSYSELVALDYWIQFDDILNINFPDRGNVTTFTDSIAKQIGQKEIDLDISFELSTKKIYTDVKCLIPTHMELVDKILKIVQSKTERKNYLIGIDDLYDVEYLRIKEDFTEELKSNNLITGLVKSINDNKNYHIHSLPSKEEVSFKITYFKTDKVTVHNTARTIDAYKLASDYKYKILDYYNKFLMDEPSLITFVINPWFNKELYLLNEEFLSTFLRSLSRTVFLELTKDSTDMESLYPILMGKSIKVSDVAKKITGIIFIKDKSIEHLGVDINETYIYLNPNASNKKLTRSDFDLLRQSQGVKQPFIDDFFHDNY